MSATGLLAGAEVVGHSGSSDVACRTFRLPVDPALHEQTLGEPGLDRDRGETVLPHEVTEHPVAQREELVNAVHALAETHHSRIADQLAEGRQIGEIVVLGVDRADRVQGRAHDAQRIVHRFEG